MIKFNILKNNKIKYNIYYLLGNNIKKKYKYTNYIIKKIKNIYKNIIIYNFFINKKFNWNLIIKEILNENIISKNKIFIINIIENIKNINYLLKENIFKLIKKKIYIILKFETKLNIKNLKIKNKKIFLIELNKKNKYKFKNYLNKQIYNLIKLINKKKINNLFKIINKLKNLNTNKILILNILFKNFIKNINNNYINILNIIKILKLFYKYEKNYKLSNNLSWNDIQLICIYLIKII